jgi:RNA polymerase sigma-54 factor
LEVRQGQGLTITTQLQQSLKLLQCSRIELEAFVQGELERNPFLSADDGDDAPSGSGDGALETTGAGLTFDGGADATAAADLGISPEDHYGDASPGERALDEAPGLSAGSGAGPLSDWPRPPGGGGNGAEGLDFAANLPHARSLRDLLRGQLALLGLADAEVGLAHVLIDSVDDGGYLRADLCEIATRLGCESTRITALVQRLQGLDPTGVFARDLRECLALQLAERNRLDPAMQALLDNLELLARRDMPALRKACAVDDDDLREMIAEVRALTPKPGAAFGSEPVAALIPDLIVHAAPGGDWVVELSTEGLPKVLVDRRYVAKVRAAPLQCTEKAFVVDHLAKAEWLVRSLDQRARTVLKVAVEIMLRQSAFLSLGIEHLRPLTLRAVADAVKVHASTVSRAISGKYIATPRGVFELKFFFTLAIPANDGSEAHSAASIRHRIRTMIQTELANPGMVLSDDRIVMMLNDSGIDIARRTVTKYREGMQIPSSFERRRMAKAGA